MPNSIDKRSYTCLLYTSVSLHDVTKSFGSEIIFSGVTAKIEDHDRIGLVGPNGTGKTTLLRVICGELEPDDGSGEIARGANLSIGYQKQNCGLSFEAVSYTHLPKTHGIRKKAELDEIVERSLRDAAIWDEVKDRLRKNALGLSGGQQQRLCIARALAVEPNVLLMDEPTSALDPISTSKIEELAMELKEKYTIVIVTHNMQQAVRISDQTAFFLLGELIEYGNTEQLFSQPKEKKTEDYITGRFG